MDAIERAVPGPQLEVAVHRRARSQILRYGPPLAAGAEDVHQAVDHLAHVHRALVAAALGRRDERRHMAPFLIGQIARIAQLAAVVPRAVLDRPHRDPSTTQADQRLERGRFVWPLAREGVARLSAAQLAMLLEAIDWRAPCRTDRTGAHDGGRPRLAC